MKLRALVVLAALLVGACNEEEPPPQPGSFDRPTRVAFVCFDVDDIKGSKLVALEECRKNPGGNVPDSTLHLHALVVQSSRGEVAAVDLVARKTLDSRPDIPGYTFLPTGELPTAIAVPVQADHVRRTYVANAGSRDVSVLNTNAFRRLTIDEQPTVQTVQLPGGNRDAPQDMVLSPDEDALFVSMPDTGRLLRLPIQRCGTDCAEDGMIDTDGITEFPLARSLELAVPSQGGDVEHDPYAQTCFYGGPIPNSTVALPVPAAGGPQPRPSGLAVDAFCETDKPCRRRLLVADAAQPLIHVIDLEELAASGVEAAVQPPILTGAPTLSVVVTPRVPAAASLESGETQYVYAIDARDGTVLVTENGKLLEIGTGARRDRITLGQGATLPQALSIAVLTPAFDIHGPAAQYTTVWPKSNLPSPMQDGGNYCADTFNPVYDPTRLRGVFLAIAASDGSLRIVDVHDMDVAECRNCETGFKEGCICSSGSMSNECEACAASWNPYPLVRHRTRIVQDPNPEIRQPRLGPAASPSFISGALATTVRTTGTTSDPNIRGLECVRCGEGQQPAFPAAVSASSAPDDDAGVPDVEVPDAAMDDNMPDAAMDGGDGAVPDDGTTDITAPCVAGAARVCALADPWVTVEDWAAFFRGTLPGSHGGQGRVDMLDGTAPQFHAEKQFCSVGVLGADALPGRVGDHLSILGDLAPDSIIRDTAPTGNSDFESKALATCNELVERRDRSTDKIPILFEIRAAYSDHLELAPELALRPSSIDPSFASDVELVNKCFGNMLLSYEVRAGAGWIVLGLNTTGFEHTVKTADGTGHCEQDPSADPRRNGRAYGGEPFDNGRVAFQIAEGAPELDTTLAVGLGAAPGSVLSKAEMSLSASVNQQVVASLPIDMRWSNTDFNVYVVDVSSRGLVPIQVSPFDRLIRISYQ